jgi:hypothetical protein
MYTGIPALSYIHSWHAELQLSLNMILIKAVSWWLVTVPVL